MLTLPSGEYLGRMLRRARLFGSPLTITAYPAGHSYPWHVHETPTLFVLLAGQHLDENRVASFDQSPLSVVFHPTHGPHATSVGPRGMVGINLEVTSTWLERCQLDRRELAKDYQLLNSLDVRILALRLATAVSDTDEDIDDELETIGLELIACLIAAGKREARSSPAWLSRAKQFLESRIYDTISLRDVAAEVGVHPVYCARAFRRAIGCTVTTYLHRLRLASAGELILNEPVNLADVALRCGFADQSHLTRTCSRDLGFTPGQLKRVRDNLIPNTGSNRSRAATTSCVPFPSCVNHSYSLL